MLIKSVLVLAMATMALGHTARRAVEIACRFDPGTGNGVDELRYAGQAEVSSEPEVVKLVA